MLIDTIDTFRTHVPVALSMTYPQLRAFLGQSRQQYLKPILGVEFLNELEEYQSGSASDDSDAMDAVLLASQRVQSLFGMYLAIPVMQLKMEETGLHAISNSEYKSAYQWQVGDYREGYLMAAYSAVEELYEVLMQYRDEPALTAWKTSDGYANYKTTLLRNAKEFSAALSIGGSHITYVDLRPAITRAEDLVVRKEICDAFYDQLIQHLSDEDSSESDPTDSDLLDIAIKKLRPALAQLAVAHATEVLFKTVNGALLSTRYDGNSTTDVKVIDDRLHNGFAAQTRATAYKIGRELLAVAKAWLDRNADDLPVYKDGPGYRPLGKEQLPLEDRMHNGRGMMMV